jgi:DNA-binding response OmpR family regulator
MFGRHLRKNGVAVPILMLTARSELNNKCRVKVGGRRLPDQAVRSPELLRANWALFRRRAERRQATVEVV